MKMELQLFNWVYFFYLGILFLALFVSLIILKNKSDEFKTRYISALLFFSLTIHFLKLLFPPYKDDPFAIRKITPENICALSTLIFPFVFLSSNKTLKDYMFYMGLISGTLACFFPLEAIGKNAFIFDTIRFYVCHIIITLAPFLMVYTGLHKLDYHRIYKVPISFAIVFCIIMINEVILTHIGLVEYDPEKGYRNFSMIFGANEYIIGTPLEDVATFFTPDYFLEIPFGPRAGERQYWPIIWAIFPMFIYVGGLSLLISLPWEKKHIKEDLKRSFNYFKELFQASKKNKI